MAMKRAGLVLVFAGGACADLTLQGVRCGQLTCGLQQYCSPESSRCEPCSDVCNQTHHNYDSGLCVKQCQDYIHDLRFVSKAGSGGSTVNSDELKSLQVQARAAIIISSVLLALFFLLCVFKCWIFTKNNKGKLSWKYLKQKWPLSKNRVKQYPADLTHHNPHAEMKLPKHELKLEIRNSSQPEPPKRHQQQPLNAKDLETRNSHTDKSLGAQTPKTVSTCLTNRHPAEDTTLDYSYDNMGMNVTPPPVQASASHNF